MPPYRPSVLTMCTVIGMNAGSSPAGGTMKNLLYLFESMIVLLVMGIGFGIALVVDTYGPRYREEMFHLENMGDLIQKKSYRKHSENIERLGGSREMVPE